MSKDVYTNIEIVQKDIGDTNILDKTFYTNIEEIKSASFQTSLCETYNADKITIIHKYKIYKGPGLGFLYKFSFKFLVTNPTKLEFHKCKTLYTLWKRVQILQNKYEINKKQLQKLDEKLKKLI